MEALSLAMLTKVSDTHMWPSLPGYKISASLTKIPTAVGNACLADDQAKLTWSVKKNLIKKIKVLTQPYTLSCLALVGDKFGNSS